MKIKVPYNKINPLSAEKDETLMSLALGTLVLGVDPETDSQREFVEYDVDNDKLPLDVADLIFSKGVKIEGFPLFIEIQSKEDLVPEGLIGAGLTWEQWKSENHTFTEIGARIFIGTNAHTNEDLSFEDLQAVRESLVLPQDLPIE